MAITPLEEQRKEKQLERSEPFKGALGNSEHTHIRIRRVSEEKRPQGVENVVDEATAENS